MGLFGFGKKKPRVSGDFSFTIEDAFAMRAGGCVVAGQVTGGEVRKGASVTCIPAQGEPFSCTVQEIEQPHPESQGEFVHPDRASAGGPWAAHYSFFISDRSKTEFHPGDRLVSGNE
ncbi:MAG: hypothetical protein HFF52_02115 [Lawsonibacter sp.]|nr:hypothetical protein [Lawsonibacter sp.]